MENQAVMMMTETLDFAPEAPAGVGRVEHNKEAILEECAAIHQQGSEKGFVTLNTELNELNAVLQEALPQMSYDDAEEIMRVFYPMIFEGMKEIASTDEEILDELEYAVDTAFMLKVEEANLTLTMMIKDGAFDYAFDQPGEARLTIHSDRPTLLRIMTGQTEGIEAYINGEVQAEGELMSCMGLRTIFERLSDVFGFRIMEFE